MRRLIIGVIIMLSVSSIFAQKVDSSNFHFYNEVQAQLKKGEKALNFDYINIEGEKVSLSSLKGKVVFLDFWASYCSYCVSQLPEVTALQERFPEIEVIRISVDHKEQAWKAASERHGLKGQNLWAGGMTYPADKYTLELFYFDASKANNTPASYELSNPIPGYVLIDQNGYIVENWAPEPGTPELHQLINQLLN